jgi:ATP-dependent DNA helicase RecG
MNRPSLATGTPPAPGARRDLLAQSLQYFKGVGPKRAELLRRLLLNSVADLLHFFPIAHKDRATVTPLAHVRLGQEVNVRARIVDVRGERFHGGKEKITALLEDESGSLRAGWWNPYVADKLTPHAWGFFSGKIITWGESRELGNADFEILGKEEEAEGSGSPSFGRIVPIYSLRPKQRRPDGTEPPEVKLSQGVLRKLVWQALEAGAAEQLPDDLPEPVRQSRGLLGRAAAVRQMHFPETSAQMEQERRRMAYEELFLLSLGVALRRMQVERREVSARLVLTPAIQARIEARLPFQLTAAQARAFREIAADLAGTRPMNRLLQGDVGCGKTAVAVAAMLLAVAHGAQAALLAPTEVLAEQHHRTLSAFLQGSRVRIGLLRGGAGAERADFRRELAAGEVHISVGTHALLEPDLAFKWLALVVVDEQHKFGVEQRSTLRAKGRAPHVLVMTATPIPRSLSLTLYGDLDLSIIDAMPPGRGEVVTRHVKEADRAKVYDLIRKEAKQGHAAYVVLPRIEGEDGGAAKAGEPTRKGRRLWSEVKGVEAEVRRLKAQLPMLRLGALHGRMPGEEKDRVLKQLREGQLDVLVSTQVIEVGIDLPKATVMVIENAELFGLSSLHQLRGRVGRGGLKSYCLFFGEPTTDEGKERLRAFANMKDGFQIAEADFQLRGPGEFFGTAQSGMPELLVADLLRDQRLLVDAREDAFALVRRDPDLQTPEHAALKRRVTQVFSGGARLGLVDVG